MIRSLLALEKDGISSSAQVSPPLQVYLPIYLSRAFQCYRLSHVSSTCISKNSVARFSTDDTKYIADLTESTRRSKKSHQIDKNLVLDVLSSAATKREAKSYISRFSLPNPIAQRQRKILSNNEKLGVNLGNLYLPPRAVDESPIFSQTHSGDRFAAQASGSLHIALVKIRAPQLLDAETLKGIGHTLSQLTHLGLSCIVVVDCDDNLGERSLIGCQTAIEQTDRVVSLIEQYDGQRARKLDGIIGVCSVKEHLKSSIKVRGHVHIIHRNLLLSPLRRGIIPVILPVGFTYDTQTLINVSAHEVLLALTREFAGIQTSPISDEVDPRQVAEGIIYSQKQFSLDRIILLDPLGGIPSSDRIHGPHIFINMEQEYEIIRGELLKAINNFKNHEVLEVLKGPNWAFLSANYLSNASFSIPMNGKNVLMPSEHRPENGTLTAPIGFSHNEHHLKNLELLKDALAILPPSSSALLTTPQAAASSGQNPQQRSSQILGVGTRRKRNPLIHNLLTDKPVFSSSLPPTRTPNPTIQTPHTSHPVFSPSPTTFVKRGMPISIIPDPAAHPWIPPSPNCPITLQLSDPRIDLSRLVHLIEDSFGRKLNVPHYLSRLTNRLAGIIIAGEYEGGALLTWEPSPSVSPFPSPPIPYLDKFAVLKRSQGAGGVADVVFKTMVRDCLPDGVCWRSRWDNPVNKWYFERAVGSWKIPGSQWTMFWTTEGLEGKDDDDARCDGQGERKGGGNLFRDYEAVCKSIVPSWMDCAGAVD